MRKLLLAAGLLLVSSAVLADMYQDASNSKLPEALVNFGYGDQLAASVTCTTGSGSAAVTGCNGTTGIKAGMAVRGSGIPAEATVQGSVTATGFSLSAAATASGSALLTIRHLPFWSDDGGQPSIWRFPGRVFIGNAIGQPSSRFALPYLTFCPDTADCANWAARDSDLAVMSSRGAMAVTGMSRSSDAAAASPPSSIGVAGFLVNDAARSGWAFYSDVQHEAAADGQYSFGVEMALKNKAGNYTSTPYSYQPGVHGIRLSAGGDPAYGGTATNPANTAIQLTPIVGGVAGSTFNKGIVFAAGVLTGADGLTAACCGTAIEMAKNHMVSWAAPNGGSGFIIHSNIDDQAGQIQLAARSNSLSVLSEGGTQHVLDLINTPLARNSVEIVNAVTGGTPRVGVTSVADANVSLTLQPQGAGTVNPSVGLRLPGYTVATLPVCNAGYTYVMAAVSDAAAPSYNATIAGGGAVKVPVMCDGVVWKAH